MATRAVYFVGTDPQRRPHDPIFQGLPYDLPLGIQLYTAPPSGVTIERCPPARRTTFTDHKLRSKDDAENLVTRSSAGQIEGMSARNRELLALVPASLLLTAGFAAIFIQETDELSNVSLTYGAVFLGLCVAAHLVSASRCPTRTRTCSRSSRCSPASASS